MKLEKCVEKFDEKTITETKESLCDAEVKFSVLKRIV